MVTPTLQSRFGESGRLVTYIILIDVSRIVGNVLLVVSSRLLWSTLTLLASIRATVLLVKVLL